MAFTFNYGIKSIANNPFQSGNLASHNYLNELGQNVLDLGNYVGSAATCNRFKFGDQSLTTSDQSISNWQSSLEFDSFDPNGDFTLGNDSIRVNKTGLYVISYNLQLVLNNPSSTMRIVKSNGYLNVDGFRRANRVVSSNLFFGDTHLSISGVYTGVISAGKFIRLVASDDDTSNNITSTVIENSTTFSIARQG